MIRFMSWLDLFECLRVCVDLVLHAPYDTLSILYTSAGFLVLLKIVCVKIKILPCGFQVLQQTMPAPIFHLLLKKLPEVSERLRASMKASGKMLQEEDVE